MQDNMQDNKLHVIINGTPVLEFDRKKPVPGHQRQYLDQMDQKMDQGIQLGDDTITQPNPLQRCQFVANSLVNALLDDNNPLAAAMCTYLAKRLPELQQIKCITSQDDRQSSDKPAMSIEFVYDRSYEASQQEETIQFYKPDNVTKH